MTSRSSLTGLAALLVLGWVFGAAFLFMKVLVEEASPGEIVFGRLFFGAVVVWAVLLARGVKVDWSPRRVLQLSALCSLEMVAPYLLIAWAEIEIDSGVAAVLISAMPLFTALIASVALPEEVLTGRHAIGLVVGFTGVIVVSGVSLDAFEDGGFVPTLAVVAAALSYAGGIVYARILLRTGDALSLTGQQLVLAATGTLALTTAFSGVPAYHLSSEGWSALVALGVVSTGLGMLGAFWMVGRFGSVHASLVTYVVPVAGLVLGWSVLGENIGLNVLGGLVLIATGVTLVLRAGRANEEPSHSLAAETPKKAVPLTLEEA